MRVEEKRKKEWEDKDMWKNEWRGKKEKQLERERVRWRLRVRKQGKRQSNSLCAHKRPCFSDVCVEVEP